MSRPADILNRLFSQKVETAEGKEKIAEYGGTYIRDHLREVSFARKVVPPQQVTKADCQRSVSHDTLVKIVDIEPESRAMAITFRGEPTARYISAPRFEIPFYTISSEKFEKTEQELLAYEMPITKVIEDNTAKDIQEIEDREFLLHIEACIEAVQQENNGGIAVAFNRTNVNAGAVVGASKVKGLNSLTLGGADDFTVRPILRPDIVNLRKLLSRNRLRPERMLMTEPDFEDVLQWTIEDFGDKIQSETVVDGYKYNMLLGTNFIRTIKTDILRDGNVYIFTKPEFFGRFYILNQTKFYIDKKANVLFWQAWEDIGMGFGNIASVRKLELYRGSVITGATDAGFAARQPVAETALGAMQNRAADGLTFPQVNQF